MGEAFPIDTGMPTIYFHLIIRPVRVKVWKPFGAIFGKRGIALALNLLFKALAEPNPKGRGARLRLSEREIHLL